MKLAEIERSLHDRTAGFRERTAHRSDEILACQEALQILRIVEMQSFRLACLCVKLEERVGEGEVVVGVVGRVGGPCCVGFWRMGCG